MTDDPNKHIPLNKDYGKGIYRRRILLKGGASRVVAELEDCHHGFRCTVAHNSAIVTDICGEAIRVPHTTCEGAMAPIKALIGVPLNTGNAAFSAITHPRANCTHLYDLTTLAIAHCSRGDITRQYDIIINDEKNGIIEARALINQRPIHHWTIRDNKIENPTELAGQPVMKGFFSWASSTFSEDQREAAFALHKGYFVSIARRWDMRVMEGQPVTDYDSRPGVCYSYSEGVVENAYRRRNSIRDFTDTPEHLLSFK